MNQDYIQPDNWSIIEEGFDAERVKSSESLFSIGNGAMGQRANFEEHYSGKTFQGSYIAGIYYPDKTKVGWWKNGYPEYFGKMFGLSSALIVNGIKGMKPGSHNDIADYDYYTQIFGDLDKLDESENNPEYLVTERLKKEEKIQPIFMACGSEDFLLNENHEFRDFLLKNKVDFTYKESTGIHDWKFWNEYLEPAIEWLLESDK